MELASNFAHCVRLGRTKSNPTTGNWVGIQVWALDLIRKDEPDPLRPPLSEEIIESDVSIPATFKTRYLTLEIMTTDSSLTMALSPKAQYKTKNAFLDTDKETDLKILSILDAAQSKKKSARKLLSKAGALFESIPLMIAT